MAMLNYQRVYNYIHIQLTNQPYVIQMGLEIGGLPGNMPEETGSQ